MLSGRRKSAIAALCGALLFSRCLVAPPPVSDQQPRGSRVVLISYDGTGADDVEELLRNDSLRKDGLGRLIAEGSYARVIPVNPTLTASAHISIATGATPQRTGIVSNRFHLPGTPRTEEASGFEVAIDTDTLWEAARRQGKRVGVITFPGVDGNGPRRTGDWGLVYTEPVLRSRLVRLQRKDFQTVSPAARSYSPAMQTKLKWEFPLDGRTVSQDVELVVLDSTDDSTENYDSVTIRAENGQANLDTGGWFTISTWVNQADARRLYGSWSKLMELDPALRQVTIYMGPISSTEGYPASYRQMIDERLGFWPGPPDEWLTEDWLERRDGVDPETFIEQIRRFSEFLTSATILSMQRMPWDLILAYQPVVDEAQHAYRIVNERQQWSTVENREAGRRVREAAYLTVDSSVEKIAKIVGGDAALLVTGDHGIAATDTLVRVNRLLADWGYVKLSDGKLSPQTPWAAFTSSSLAHIYAFDRPSPDRIEQLAKKLRALRAPDGDVVFERVHVRTKADHSNSGDIVAYGYPRFGMSRSLESGVFVKSTSFGQHGGLNHHREYHTIFAAIGPGVGKWRGSAINQTQIAASVARLMGIKPPDHAETESGAPGL